MDCLFDFAIVRLFAFVDENFLYLCSSISQDNGPVVEAQVMLLPCLEPHRMIPLRSTYQTGTSERVVPLFEGFS